MKHRNLERGAVSLLLIAGLVGLSAVLFFVLHEGAEIQARIELQRAADAAATSGAVWEARAYNLIAAMNEGILICVTTAFTALAIVAALKICAATVVGAAVCGLALANTEEMLIQTAKTSWQTATELSSLERYIQKSAPYFVLYATDQSARDNGAEHGFSYPYIPEGMGGDHDRLSTLTLHLKDGGFKAVEKKVLEKLSLQLPGPVDKVLDLLLVLVDQILRTAGEDPDPLVLDDDFRPRMKHGVVAWRSFPGKPQGLMGVSQATPFLPNPENGKEDLFEMNWRVKLRPVDFLEEISDAVDRFVRNQTTVD